MGPPGHVNVTGFDAPLTLNLCAAICGLVLEGEDDVWFGVGEATVCYCGYSFTLTSLGDCNSTCPGDPAQMCGGPDSVSLYALDNQCVFDPTPVPTPGKFPRGT